MTKKAQSISINTIIIAAIALAVLVVIFSIFTGRFKIFSEGVKEGSLTCDRACKTTGYSGGGSASACSSAQSQISGRFEGVESPNFCCCSS